VAPLTDTHCHLNLKQFQDDLPSVLRNAWDAGLERILIPGIDLVTSRRALDITALDPRLMAAVGVHPSDALTWTDETPKALYHLALHPAAIAVGEIGLDYYRDRAPRDLQRAIFQSQLRIAADLGKPVSIHIRDAWEDTWTELQAWHDGLLRSGSPLAQRPGVLHSFSGTIDQALQAAGRGFFLGISGPVTFTNAPQRQDLVAALPLGQILVETDSPYLTPHPHRGKRNEPAYTHFIVKKIAELRHLAYNQTAAITADNAARLFAWRAPS
jgi:TatD DNase family protein